MSHQQQRELKGLHSCYALDVELNVIHIKKAGGLSHEE